MLWFDLIDIIFFIAGGLIGAIVMSALAAASCDECRSRRYNDERE